MKMRYTRRLISIGLAALMLVSLCAVCASTGVAAATTSGGIQTSSQAQITSTVGAPPGGLASAPSVCSWGSNRLDVFAEGGDNNLWHAWWDGTWHSWENLGAPAGGLQSAPSAVSWGSNRIDIFVRGADGGLWHLWFPHSSSWWGDWESLGVPVSLWGVPLVTINANTAPAACSWGAYRLDIFVTGSDGQLWQKWYDLSQNGWHDWALLGKPSAGLDGSPGAVSTVSWGYQRVDIFIRGADGALWQLWYKNDWQPWYKVDTGGALLARDPLSIYGQYQYAPTACSWGANRLDIFFVDNSGNLQQKYFDNGWKPLNPLTPGYISAAPSAVVWKLGATTRIDIFVRGSQFELVQLYWALNSGWHGWYSLAGYIS